MKKDPTQFKKIKIKDYSLRILEEFKEVHISGKVNGYSSPKKFVLSQSFISASASVGDVMFGVTDKEIISGPLSEFRVYDLLDENIYIFKGPSDKLKNDFKEISFYLYNLKR